MYKIYADDYLLYDDQIESLKVFNPKLTLELNKTGSFAFTIYTNHPYYETIKKLKTIVTVYQDDFLIFRGRVLNIEEGFYSQRSVDCEGELAFLLDSIQRPYEFTGSIEAYLEMLIDNHNSQVLTAQQFTLGNVTVTDPNDYITRSNSDYMSTWEEINKKLVELLGGYISVRHENGVNYIDYLEDFNLLAPQKVEFAKNLLDLKLLKKGEEIYTGIIPLGAKLKDEEGNETSERLTIASVNNGLDYLVDEEAVALHNTRNFKTQIWDDVTLASNLLTKGRLALGTLKENKDTIELTAADMATANKDITSFHVGTYVEVISNPHGIEQLLLITKLSIDLFNPAANKLTLGGTVESFTSQTNKVLGNIVSSKDGKDGKDGESGTSSFLHIRYSANANGSNMTETPQPDTAYIGTAVTTSETAPTSASAYDWVKTKGENGKDGEDGSDGKDGQNGKDGVTYYTWIKYADTPTSGMSDNPEGKTYMGLAYNKTTQTESTNYSDYSWSLIKGADGSDGTNGTNGKDGKTYYTWVKYADDASGTNMSNDPTNKKYIGLAYNKETSTESTNASDYSWALFRGADGVDGTDGKDGSDGKGIASITEYYLATTASSGVTTGTTGWTTTVQAVTSTKKYLWNYEVISYTTGNPTTTAPVIIGVYGDKGTDGKGITSVTNYYLATDVATGVTTSTIGWTPTIQNITADKKYLWNYEVIAYTTGNPTTTAPVIIGVYGQKGQDGKDAAIQSTTAPSDTSYMWLDISIEPPVLKRYNPTTQVWEIISDTTAISESIILLEQNLNATISDTESSILSTVSESYYLKGETDKLVSETKTDLEQTIGGWDYKFTTFNADLEALAKGTDAEFEKIQKYIRFIDGKILLGEVGNQLELRIANDRISFMQSGAEVAYFSNNKLYVVDGEFTNSLKLGNFAFLPRANGNLSFKRL